MAEAVKIGRIVYRQISSLPWVEIDEGPNKVYVPLHHDQALRIVVVEGQQVRIKLVMPESKYFLSQYGYAIIIE